MKRHRAWNIFMEEWLVVEVMEHDKVGSRCSGNVVDKRTLMIMKQLC